MDEILIVDDIPMNRRVLKSLILSTVKNVTVIEAEDGEKALAMMQTNRISLVILDIMMPIKDGLQVLQEMKSDKSLSNIPVIMFTALDDEQNLEKALSLGAIDYFTKPLREQHMRISLPLKIRNALQYHGQRTEITRLYTEIKSELETAKELQEALVSKNGELGNVQIYAQYKPCDEIGGDFYSCRIVNGRCWFIIADVAGHGITAAMGSAMLKIVFNNSIQNCSRPEQVLQQINQTMLGIYGNMEHGSLTAFVGCIEGDRLYVANAGQPYPVLFHANTAKTSQINLDGFLLGMLDSISFDSASYEIHAGDCILLYTDGILNNEDDYASWDKIDRYCEQHKLSLTSEPDSFVKEMLAHFMEGCGNKACQSSDDRHFNDDAAIMLVKINKTDEQDFQSI